MFIFACNSSSYSYDEDDESFDTYEESEEEVDPYPNGTYCAEIEYYNPNTYTRSTYTLNVDVRNHELEKIHWPNGGWLDEDHFYSPDIDDDGTCSFTSDKGYRYHVEITGPECGYTDSYRFNSDREDEHKEYTCPKCGKEKHSYNDDCEEDLKDNEDY